MVDEPSVVTGLDAVELGAIEAPTDVDGTLAWTVVVAQDAPMPQCSRLASSLEQADTAAATMTTATNRFTTLRTRAECATTMPSVQCRTADLGGLGRDRDSGSAHNR